MVSFSILSCLQELNAKMDFLVDCQMTVIAPIPPYGGTDAHPQGHPVISREANIMFSSVIALTASVASRNELVSLTP